MMLQFNCLLLVKKAVSGIIKTWLRIGQLACLQAHGRKRERERGGDDFKMNHILKAGMIDFCGCTSRQARLFTWCVRHGEPKSTMMTLSTAPVHAGHVVDIGQTGPSTQKTRKTT
eukprot:TRINITY_DN32525_c0_g1_i1.p1 TRINITY_DN32525_c0_g1~~TRINITY_DN32525_c0_g1_i1.p1  ORF type:complete len:115 (-),score=1.65 TRINITY_DN32525_c0_g1_i1:15-359(-)